MITRLIFASCLMALLYGCTDRNQFRQLKDRDITLQVLPVKSNAQDTGLAIFQIRIIPDKALMLEQTIKQKNGLMYGMDSCFYFQQNGQKIYPVLVQYIASGVGGAFDYMLQFENEQAGVKGIILTWQDKYLTKKSYDLKMNDN